ncbi:hypothetical protein F4801DRAFT_584354 [Xylaria longipes]|nr:hypothetical protein F4801DRAFT_584354 [Xylaria longipes]
MAILLVHFLSQLTLSVADTATSAATPSVRHPWTVHSSIRSLPLTSDMIMSSSATDLPARAAALPTAPSVPAFSAVYSSVCPPPPASDTMISPTTDFLARPANRDPGLPERKRSRIAKRCRRFVNKLPMVSSLKRKLKKTNDLRSKLQPLQDVNLVAAAKIYELLRGRKHASVPNDDDNDDNDDNDDETATEIVTEMITTIGDTADFAAELGQLGGSDFFDILSGIGDVVLTICDVVGDILGGT